MSELSDSLRTRAEASLKKQLLQMVPTVPDAEWEVFRVQLAPRALKAGDSIARMGEVATEYGWVLAGVIRRYSVSAEGREVVKGFVEPGGFVGDYRSLLTGEPSDQTVEAMEPSQLLVGTYARFVSLYDRHPCWQQAGRKLAERFFLIRDQRETEFLTLSATERYERFLEQHSTLVGRVPQRQIASYLGVTPVSLSRLIARRRAQAGRFRDE